MLRCEACEGSTHQLGHGRSVPILLVGCLSPGTTSMETHKFRYLRRGAVVCHASRFRVVRNSSGVYNGGINETTSNCATSAHAMIDGMPGRLC